MNTTSHSVIVRESYGSTAPSFDAGLVVRRLLDGIPSKYLIGLKTVVLTDTAELNHAERRKKTQLRGKTIRIRVCRGLYNHASKNAPAWIEIFMDNCARDWPLRLLKVAFFADFALSEILFHEIGHHIHATQAPEFKEREDVAEDWRKRLSKIYFRKRYWYSIPVAYMLYPVSWLAKKVLRSDE